jgi:protein deglycase
MKKRVLFLLGTGFEEIETVTPIDLLRRADAEVIVASVSGDQLVTGRSQITLRADASLADVAEEEFDLLVVPGGPGVKALRADGRPAKLAQAFHKSGKIVAAICAGPTVLKDARLLDGKRFTAHFSVFEELPQALADERVVRDEAILTSRGAGTAVDFGLALVEALFGAEKSKEIARAIMA